MLDFGPGGLDRRVSLLALLVLIGGAAAPVSAAMAPPAPLAKPVTGRMVDARVNLTDSFERSSTARPGAVANGRISAERQVRDILAATRELKRSMPGLDVKLSPTTAATSQVRNPGGALTQAAPGVPSETIVRQFLAENARIYGLSGADLADLAVLGDSAGGSSGLRMLRMEQRVDGRPVFQSETRFLLDRDGRLVSSLGLMIPNARFLAPKVSPSRLMPAAEAVARLLVSTGKASNALSFTAGETVNGWIQLAETDATATGPVSVREVYFPLAPGVLVPAWSMVVFTEGDADWYAVVDQETGDVLWRKNIRNYASAHDARFRVYVQADGVTPADSPAPQSPNTAVPGAGTQFPEIAPTIVSMHTAMSATASPNGWIDDCPGGVCTANETQTLGNNVLACLDRAGTANVCDTDAASVLDGNGRPTGNPDANGRNRDFLGTAPRDFQTGFLPPPQGGNPEAGQTATGAGSSGTNALDQFRRGSVTGQFYAANWYHDQLFLLGFDEASGNFQNINVTGMGLGGDRVLLDVQDASGTNNANFGTPPDGVSGRAQMFRFTGPTIDRDGGLDNEILFHELTHGTSNRLVGNGAGLNWDSAAGMGEGWSDFYALSLLNGTASDNPDARYASGGYATYKLGGLLDNYVYGIRRFPYSTDNTVNPMTWADVDDVTINLSGGIAPSPLNFNDNGGMEVHNSGEIWALTLWEVRSRIIAANGGNIPAGNTTALELVTDGLKMTPVDPSFTDARDAILDADCATNSCANEDSIWGGFADRGLGYGAYTPYYASFGYTASHMGIRESFVSPFLNVVDADADVAIDDSASNNNGAIDAGEAVRLTVTLTNPWRAASKAVTGATATLTTSTPGVTIIDNSSTYGAIAPNGTAAGDSFLITLDTNLTCGSAIDFTLTTTSNLGTTSTTFRLRVGTPAGTGAPVTYTRDTTPDLAIPDGRPRAVVDSLTITDDFEIADLDFRIDSATHTFTGDLTFMLRSPGAVGVDSISLIGGLTDGGTGDNIVNMVVDDETAATATNDMVQVLAAAAPYTKSWIPVFNGPWTTLAGFPAADPVGTFSRYDGTSTLGTWTVAASDQFAADTGTLNSWSIIVTPAAFACTTFAPAANVAATKTVAGTFTVGSTVTYTVTLTNNGTDNQTDNAGNEFTDTLPAGLTLVTATATSGTATTAGNTVNWNGSLAPLGGTVTITITATINAGTQGTSISNQGTASFDGNNDNVNEATSLTDDPSVGGASDPTVFVVGAASLTGTKTVTGTFEVGGTVTYTIVLTNSGSSATADNAGDELTDILPAGLTLVSATATSGIATTAGNTVHWNGGIPAGGSVTITITATINQNAAGTTISNQATFFFDADLNGSNESSGVTDDPGQAGSSDQTVFEVEGTTPSPVEVPTVTELGLLALALALATIAMTRLRKQTV